MPTIIFYDGDGGGFAGQLRSLFEAKFWGFLANIPVLDIYAYTNILYQTVNANVINYPLDISVQNSISLSELLLDAIDLPTAINCISRCEHKYILAGRHHYTKSFRKYAQPTFEQCFDDFAKKLLCNYKQVSYRCSTLINWIKSSYMTNLTFNSDSYYD